MIIFYCVRSSCDTISLYYIQKLHRNVVTNYFEISGCSSRDIT